MMNEQDIAQKNMELSTEFSRYLFAHPEIEEQIPPEAEILFLPDYDPELREYNRKLGAQLSHKGTSIIFVRIKALRPKVFSRITDIEFVTSETSPDIGA